VIERNIGVLSIILNVVLAFLLYRMARPTQTSGVLPVGMQSTTLVGADLRGEFSEVQFPRRIPVVLYFFSPQCSWCERNNESIKSLVRRIAPSYDFVAVSVDEAGLREWVILNPPEYPVWSRLAFRTALQYPIRSTPTTVVLSSTGTVERVWTGAFVGSVQEQIEAYFAVALPSP
jgi:hypothetical protein